MAVIDRIEHIDDGTMSFGEHIEELRVHLIRALLGLLVSCVVMTLFAGQVVQVIVEPVREQLVGYLEGQSKLRLAEFKQQILDDPHMQEATMHMKVRLDDTSFAALAGRLGLPESASASADAKAGADAAEPLVLSVATDTIDVVDQLRMPLMKVSGRFRLKTLSAQEPFLIYFKAVLGAALVAASPWIFYQLYSFIAVGLYAHERRFVHLTLPFSVLLFLTGVSVCFFIVFPTMLSFFLSTNAWVNTDPDIRLSEWVGFAVILMLIFGITFQMPLLMLMLERVGLITYEMLAGKRRIAWFVNIILAAVITPGGDPNTMAFLALPMVLLFELGLFLMHTFRRRDPFAVTGD